MFHRSSISQLLRIFQSCYGLLLLLVRLSSNYIFVIYFSGQFQITLMVFVHQEFVAVLILFFQCLVFFQRNLLTLFEISCFVINIYITLNVYNIPINFGLFNNFEKPFAIEPPDLPSVSYILNVSYKPPYSSYTPSTDACKLSHLVLTAFFTFALLSGSVSILCILCAVFM